MHSLRRNVRMTCITHNNQIYGLTTGQASPTTDHLMRTVSTPGGVLEQPVNPIGLALAEEATFVARGFAGDLDHLTDLYKQAFEHKGFALVDVFQPCVTWNKLNTAAWYKERIYKLEDTGWDPTDRSAAFDHARENGDTGFEARGNSRRNWAPVCTGMTAGGILQSVSKSSSK